MYFVNVFLFKMIIIHVFFPFIYLYSQLMGSMVGSFAPIVVKNVFIVRAFGKNKF